MSNPLLDTRALPRFADLEPRHVLPALTTTIERHRSQLSQLLNDNDRNSDFDALVLPVEEMEHELSRIWSPVSHLQSVLGSGEWRDAYNEALPLLTEYGTELSQNTALQQAYARVDAALGDGGDEEQKAALRLALRDFHLAGVDLDDDAKARFRDIMRELAVAQAAFEQNVQDASDAWRLTVETVEELSGLSDRVIARARDEAAKHRQDGWVLTLDFPTYHAVLTYADNRSLREVLYHAWVTRASDQGGTPEHDNSALIDSILTLRQEAAALLGFDHYAEYSLATKMAATTDEVLAFLSELAEHARGPAQAELDDLTDMAGMTIEPWDSAYWLEKLKTSRYALSNDELREYFPADAVLNGLFSLAGRLYGLEIVPRDDVEIWHDDVRFFEVRERGGDTIGSFYADLYARPGKRNGAWIDDCVNRKAVGNNPALPVGFLVANFSPSLDGTPSTLNHDEVVTLFHEFGHMLHHLLTRVGVPSIAGINGVPWDAVELPSQFMENFAWRYEVLAKCSAHVDSGAPLPREHFDRLEASRHAGAALAMLRQLEFALFDFRLHAGPTPADAAGLLATLDAVRDEVSLLQHPAYNRLPHAFSHIFAGGYAAGYYSYKWAEVLAADAFEAFLEAGLLDPDVASRFRREILEIGGSRDFMDAYVAFRGRKPAVEALLRQSGIAAA